MLDKTSKFSDKFRERLCQTIREECKARGLPHFLDLGKNGTASLYITDHVHDKRRGEHIALLTAGGWAKYSRRWMSAMGWNGVRRDLAILGGTGRQGAWAARVPASCTNVASALAWLKPARVRKAEERGLTVARQGDVWIVQRWKHRPGAEFVDDVRFLPASHTWIPTGRVMVHAGHGELLIPFSFVAIPQRTLAADGRRRRQGD